MKLNKIAPKGCVKGILKKTTALTIASSLMLMAGCNDKETYYDTEGYALVYIDGDLHLTFKCEETYNNYYWDGLDVKAKLDNLNDHIGEEEDTQFVFSEDIDRQPFYAFIDLGKLINNPSFNSETFEFFDGNTEELHQYVRDNYLYDINVYAESDGKTTHRVLGFYEFCNDITGETNYHVGYEASRVYDNGQIYDIVDGKIYDKPSLGECIFTPITEFYEEEKISATKAAEMLEQYKNGMCLETTTEPTTTVATTETQTTEPTTTATTMEVQTAEPTTTTTEQDFEIYMRPYSFEEYAGIFQQIKEDIESLEKEGKTVSDIIYQNLANPPAEHSFETAKESIDRLVSTLKKDADLYIKTYNSNYSYDTKEKTYNEIIDHLHLMIYVYYDQIARWTMASQVPEELGRCYFLYRNCDSIDKDLPKDILIFQSSGEDDIILKSLINTDYEHKYSELQVRMYNEIIAADSNLLVGIQQLAKYDNEIYKEYAKNIISLLTTKYEFVPTGEANSYYVYTNESLYNYAQDRENKGIDLYAERIYGFLENKEENLDEVLEVVGRKIPEPTQEENKVMTYK